MIARISGKITERGENCLLIDNAGITYEVLIPVTVMQRIDENLNNGNIISLITYHYYQMEPSRGLPVLIGFLNEVEKEFFECFITVSGIGPKAALRALNKPISQIAKAIDEADLVFLKSLPGIGQQRAKEIVAKLQNKIGKFGLIRDEAVKETKPEGKLVEDEALAVLIQLQYKRSEALNMVKKALEHNKEIQTTEDLLNEVYKQKKTE